MIAVAGASGFVGRAFCRMLELRGKRVLRIGRRDADVRWPSVGEEFGEDARERLRGVRAVVNLAGEPIGARWTDARRHAIRDSRVRLTAVLARAIALLDPRPAVLVSASAVGIYGDRGDEWLDEASRPGDGFLANVAREWEAATEPARLSGIRVVLLRLGIVVGPGGGIVSQLRPAFRLALGARLGDGSQWMSWISLADTVRCIARAVDDDQVRGVVNVVSPHPVTNSDFTKAFARASGRPAVLAAPAFALRVVFGEMADGVLLSSQRVRPAQLLAQQYAFENPSLEGTLRTALDQ
ncbi:MAG: TIGR01777 family oxidoreductase [Gemmatimonadetes bacterium]|nr:TIGR01777 family oxidoreductase [Gemmatimonadota bacterium]